MLSKINNMWWGILLLFCMTVASCRYQEIVDADFPDGVIYLPAAKDGYYEINSRPTGTTTYRFQINAAANAFIVPLSVYRSGLDVSSSFAVDIEADSDTIAALSAEGAFETDAVIVLPTEKYELTSPVRMNGGERTAPFSLKVDLDFLLSDEAKDKIYALGVHISSAGCASNEALNTAIILIHPQILHPE